MRIKIRAFLELMRPANVITALTDVLAGMAIVGFTFGTIDYQFWPVIFLGISTMCLYAGGVVFNDIFDHEPSKDLNEHYPVVVFNVLKPFLVESSCFHWEFS
jgi:1,4-dihydroxy-2-naphthoate octaprenyltransferase